MTWTAEQLSAQFHVGAIGFSYPDWQGTFYPGGTRSGDFLATYAQAFDTLELDTTFHAIPALERVKKWALAVPEGFCFCPKTPRLITHDAPLATALPTMLAFLRALSPMHEAGKLGPVLIQFPPFFLRSSRDLLGSFLSALPSTHRYAVELRHKSWLHPSTAELLASHRCAWVAGDYSTEPWPIHATTDFFYLRFVGRHHQFPSDDQERIDPTERLEKWIAALHGVLQEKPIPPHHKMPVFALFANDFAGHAPATANRFRRLVGLPVTLPGDLKKTPVQQSLF